jgi:aldehyde dehydrogenase (NAD+)
VAPDYILCDPAVKDQLISCLCAEVRRQFGEKPLENGDYGKIVSRKHFDRVCGLMDPEKTVLGGGADEATLRIEPTILDNVTFDDPVMKEEIFGPILPILTFDSAEEIISTVNGNDKPLALYVFATDRGFISNVTSRCSYGGGCVNDVVIHLATSNMGFGGVGESGMGSYHGKDGFDTFTHYKSIVHKKNWLDLPMRYQPYRPFYRQLIEFFLR